MNRIFVSYKCLVQDVCLPEAELKSCELFLGTMHEPKITVCFDDAACVVVSPLTTLLIRDIKRQTGS